MNGTWLEGVKSSLYNYREFYHFPSGYVCKHFIILINDIIIVCLFNIVG